MSLASHFRLYGYPGVDFKPVFLSSGLAVSNEHAVEVVDPDFHAESSAVVQGKSCVERAISHGFDVSLSGGTCGKDTSPAHHARSQPGVGTQFAHVGYPRVDFVVEAVVRGFPSESSAVSHGVDVAMSGGSCGKGTSPAYLARSQPGVSTQCAHVGYPGVELVSRATYISRKKRNLETVQRQSKALKKAQRDAKRKFVAQPEISHEAAEFFFKEPGNSHRREISWYHTRQPPSRLAACARERVFLHTVWCRQRWWSFEAIEVSMRRIWRIPSESETQA